MTDRSITVAMMVPVLSAPTKRIVVVEIHTPDEVTQEVARIRPRLETLLADGEVRPFCIEEDLRTLAYNNLTLSKHA